MAPSSSRASTPDLVLETGLFAEHDWMFAADEVGRGALAGPVAVGVVRLDRCPGRVPTGLRDSKLLSAGARRSLVEPVRAWVDAYGVGFASAAEIDTSGIVAALRLAGHRAVRACGGVLTGAGVVLLDGNFDWLSPPEPIDGELLSLPPVVTSVKADRRAASVAAASVLAKVARDDRMSVLADRYPSYGWTTNKGYTSALHVAALTAHGPCDEHRRSWRLPGVSDVVPTSD